MKGMERGSRGWEEGRLVVLVGRGRVGCEASGHGG